MLKLNRLDVQVGNFLKIFHVAGYQRRSSRKSGGSNKAIGQLDVVRGFNTSA